MVKIFIELLVLYLNFIVLNDINIALAGETGQELDLSSSEAANDSQESIADESQDTSMEASFDHTEQVNVDVIWILEMILSRSRVCMSSFTGV